MAIYLCLCDKDNCYCFYEVHCLTARPKKGNRYHWGVQRKRNLIKAKEEVLLKWKMNRFDKLFRPCANVQFFIDFKRLCQFEDEVLGGIVKDCPELRLTDTFDRVMCKRGCRPTHGVLVYDIDNI